MPTLTSTAYSTPFTVSSNCVITYIYTDGTNIGGSNTANITTIDKTAPSKPVYQAYYKDDNSSYTSGTTAYKAVNTRITVTDGLSGIREIQCSYDKTNWSTLKLAESSGLQQNGNTYYGIEDWTFSEGRNTTAYFRAIDNVGNVSEISDAFNIIYHAHAFTQQGNLRSAATCQAAATYWYKCSCGLQGSTYFSSGGTIAHSYTAQGNLRSSATCQSAATYWYKCSMCGAQGSNYFTSGGTIAHSYTAQGNLRSSATCQAAATYWYKCSMCGAQGSNYFTSGGTVGHSYTAQGNLRSSASCTEAATYWYKCSMCGAQGSNYFASGSALGHNYVAQTTSYNPVSDNGGGSPTTCTQHKNCKIYNWTVKFNCCGKTGSCTVHSTWGWGPSNIWDACHGGSTCTKYVCSRCGAQ